MEKTLYTACDVVKGKKEFVGIFEEKERAISKISFNAEIPEVEPLGRYSIIAEYRCDVDEDFTFECTAALMAACLGGDLIKSTIYIKEEF